MIGTEHQATIEHSHPSPVAKERKQGREAGREGEKKRAFDKRHLSGESEGRKHKYACSDFIILSIQL